jgi:hypothetical protein
MSVIDVVKKIGNRLMQEEGKWSPTGDQEQSIL